MIAIEQCHEGSLGSSGSLDTSELEIVTSTLEVAKIPQQFLDPESGTLANGDQLGGLEMSETESGQITVFGSKLAENVDDTSELVQQDIIAITNDDQITIV